MLGHMTASLKSVSKEAQCLPAPTRPLLGKAPVVLLSDSTCKLNSSKSSRYVDYTTEGDGYCQIFDRSRGDAFLVSAVWCGA